jgi:hypothetical protein
MTSNNASIANLPLEAEGSFDGLAHAHIVGDEKADRVQPQGHPQGDKLIGPGPDGDAPQRTEGRRPLPQQEPGRLPEQAHALDVRDLACIRKGEPGGFHPLGRERIPEQVAEPAVDGQGLIAGSRQGSESEDLIFGGDEHPVPIAEADDRARLHPLLPRGVPHKSCADYPCEERPVAQVPLVELYGV